MGVKVGQRGGTGTFDSRTAMQDFKNCNVDEEEAKKCQWKEMRR